MNQRTFLGLSHNPFTAPRDGFYAGGDRKTHLDHLRHLSQWSRRVLVVTGSFGIGKSSLFRELSDSLEPNTKAARLSGTVVTSERETLVGLLQGFGIAASADAHADELATLIEKHANEQDAQGRVCMVMVDDAHLLEVQAIQRLVSLVATSSLRMLFFAEASLINNLNRAARKNELEWFEIRLTGFPKADIREYLEWRFEQAHYRGSLPFTDDQLEKIVARSSGNPRVVDSMANRLLTDMESGEVRNQGGFPTMHVTLAVLLLMMLGLVYLFVRDETNELESMAEPILAAAVDGEGIVGDEVFVSEIDDQLFVDEFTAEPLDEPPPDVVPLEDQPAVATLIEPEPEPEPEIIPAPEAAVVSEPPGSFDEAFHSGTWLLQQDPGRYTLQLLTLSSRDRAVAFINRQDNPAEFVLYRMRRDGKLMHIITYGVFSGHAAAVAASQQLGGEMARLKAWARPLALVQDTIRGTPQD